MHGSGENLKYQLPMTEEINLPALTEPGREIKIIFFAKLHSKHVTREPYIVIGIDRYNKKPIVWIWKSTEAGEVLKLLLSFINLYVVPEKIKSNLVSEFISKSYREVWKKYIEVKYSPPR